MKNIFRISFLILILHVFNSCKEKPTPPVLTTTAVTAISYTTATSGGEITDDGGDPIVSKGICWNTSPDPTVSNSKTTESGNMGTFINNITSLIPNTTYFVRAYGTNTAGTGYGESVTFTTLQVAVPVLTTTVVSAITQTTAVSGGNISDEKGAAITARGICWSTSQNPTIVDSKTSEGTGSGAFTSSITGLTQGTTYFVRGYATNSVGTSYGTQESFTTLGPATVTTAEITTITQTTATGGGNVTAAGGTTVTARGVCWSINQNPTITDNKSSDGTGIGVFTSAITGLTGNTTYYVRAYATNSVSTSYGNQIVFKTSPVLPTVTTTTVTALTATTCTSGGNITNDGGATITERGVCWSKTANPTILDSKTSNGTGSGTFTSAIVGLSAVTTYVRAYATNIVGTAYGSEIPVTTLGQAPTATTVAATSITSTGATLNGTVSANYLTTVVTFDYGTTTSYGSIATVTQSPVSGSANTSVNVSITGLNGGTIYHYRVKAVNELGNTFGNDMTFTTLGQIPSATTAAATSISTTGATLNGIVNPNYLSTSVIFEYGTTTAYGNTSSVTQSPITGNTSSNISTIISGLLPGTTYHFRVKAVNLLGTTIGNDLTVITLGQVPTATTLAATSITTTNAILNGTVNANDLGTTVTFEYGTTDAYGITIDATPKLISPSINVTVTASLTGLNPGTLYHFRVKAVNSIGTTYGIDIAFITSVTTLGATYQGGLVFYIDGTGQHGLVCAPTDQSTSAAWGCEGTEITGADGTVVGTGYQNTIDIINGCSTEGKAAKICYDLVLNGYDDWFLPSIDELTLMYENLYKKNLGGFSANVYWSSSELNFSLAWFLNIPGMGSGGSGKNFTRYIRAVRAF